jgi:hypothetical protein
MTSEISHRCPSCGAAVRDFGERAMFCPECGKSLTAPEEKTANSSDDRSVDPPMTPEPLHITEGGGVSSLASSASSEAAQPERHERQGAVGKTRETLHRASNVARGAIEHNVQRVKKVEHVSAVMLEEASSDPSLRFVLVALGLFVLFIILLVVSKVMG